MKKITLGEFERGCEAELRGGKRGRFLSEEQNWFDPVFVPVVNYIFDKINVMFGPDRIALCTGSSYIDLLFIKEIYIETDANFTSYIVVCGDKDNERTYKFFLK